LNSNLVVRCAARNDVCSSGAEVGFRGFPRNFAFLFASNKFLAQLLVKPW
jgi:hypothetical protein